MYAHVLTQSSRGGFNKTVVNVELGTCQSEIDVTIVDRISSLLERQRLAERQPSASASQTVAGHSVEQVAFNDDVTHNVRIHNVRLRTSVLL